LNDNDPSISAISNQVMSEDATLRVNYTIADEDTSLSCTGSVTVISSNTALLQNV
jgi:hypothetical protein